MVNKRRLIILEDENIYKKRKTEEDNPHKVLDIPDLEDDDALRISHDYNSSEDEDEYYDPRYYYDHDYDYNSDEDEDNVCIYDDDAVNGINDEFKEALRDNNVPELNSLIDKYGEHIEFDIYKKAKLTELGVYVHTIDNDEENSKIYNLSNLLKKSFSDILLSPHLNLERLEGIAKIKIDSSINNETIGNFYEIIIEQYKELSLEQEIPDLANNENIIKRIRELVKYINNFELFHKFLENDLLIYNQNVTKEENTFLNYIFYNLITNAKIDHIEKLSNTLKEKKIEYKMENSLKNLTKNMVGLKKDINKLDRNEEDYEGNVISQIECFERKFREKIEKENLGDLNKVLNRYEAKNFAKSFSPILTLKKQGKICDNNLVDIFSFIDNSYKKSELENFIAAREKSEENLESFANRLVKQTEESINKINQR